MELNVGMCGQPGVTFFVCAVRLSRITCNSISGAVSATTWSNKLQELFPSFPFGEGGADSSCRPSKAANRLSVPCRL